MKKKIIRKIPFILFSFITLVIVSGCVKLVLRSSHSVVTNLTQAVFEECDPRLAELSIPSELKILEGILKNDPGNKHLLISLCTGFTGYSLLFVEQEDPEWASSLYLRARNYGLRALGAEEQALNERGVHKEAIMDLLRGIGKSDIESLFWTTMSWNAWINLNLDKPHALSQIGISEACLKKILDIEPDFMYGSPYVLMGTILSAKPKMLGGDADAAKGFFEKAMDSSNGDFLLVHYFFAKYYAVRVQNKALFLQLISLAEEYPPDRVKGACLINSVMKKRILRLKKDMDKLFF